MTISAITRDLWCTHRKFVRLIVLPGAGATIVGQGPGVSLRGHRQAIAGDTATKPNVSYLNILCISSLQNSSSIQYFTLYGGSSVATTPRPSSRTRNITSRQGKLLLGLRAQFEHERKGEGDSVTELTGSHVGNAVTWPLTTVSSHGDPPQTLEANARTRDSGVGGDEQTGRTRFQRYGGARYPRPTQSRNSERNGARPNSAAAKRASRPSTTRGR